MITLLLVDDQPEVLSGLETRLAVEPDIRVVGTSDTATMAIQRTRELRPDVVVMDVRLPGRDGIWATRQIGMECPASRVVVLSLYADPATQQWARVAGARGFVSTHDMAGTLIATIRQVTA